jgi:hypothetical protein
MSKKVVAVIPNQANINNIKYIHCRCIDHDGNVKAHGGMTIAYLVDAAFKVVGYAGSKCHTNDNYNKHLGRAKAGGRLRSSEYYQHIAEPLPETDFIKTMQEGFKREFNGAF